MKVGAKVKLFSNVSQMRGHIASFASYTSFFAASKINDKE